MENNKRNILVSALTIAFCVILCLGTTFAFFADGATSANNKVHAGTLQVDFQLLQKGSTENWTSIKQSNAPIFSEDTVWEPGYTDIKVLRVVNNGALSIHWEARYASQTPLTDLANALEVYIKVSDTSFAYPTARAELDSWEKMSFVEFINNINEELNGDLAKNESSYFGIALRMDPNAGNEYQGLSLDYFDIVIVATQSSDESDFFGNDYDTCSHSRTQTVAGTSATCTTSGLKNGEVCLDCGMTVTAQQVIAKDPTAHTPNTEEWFVEIKPTVETVGKEYCKCAFCGERVEEREIPKLVPSDLSYAYNGEDYFVKGVGDNFSGNHLVIPGTYNGGSVIGIWDDSFIDNLTIEELTISEGITSIGMAAFVNCRMLKSVSLPSSISNISDYSFAGCIELTEIHYAGTIDQWGEIAFDTMGSSMPWNERTGDYTIYCTDGQIAKDGTITKN